MPSDPIGVTLLVTDALERLGVPYFLGGSLCSSIYGMPRATLDADIIADLRLDHVERFVRLLRERFYVDTEMVRKAVRERDSFNVIHLESMFKVDVYPAGQDAFSRIQFRRKRKENVGPGGRHHVFVASPTCSTRQ